MSNDLESRVRESLARRADSVEVTPALYVKVQDGIARAGRLRVLGLVAATAGGILAITFGAALLPRVTTPDIVDAPPTEQAPAETEEATIELPEVTACASLGIGGDIGIEGPVNGTQRGIECSTATAEAVAEGGDPPAIVASLRTDGPIGADVRIPGRDTLRVAGPVTGIAVGDAWNPDDGITVLAGEDDDGPFVGIVDQLLGTSGPMLRIDAEPNGGGVVVTPDDGAVAWVEGTDLHLQPTRGRVGLTLPAPRVVPLGAVRSDLVLEHWTWNDGLLLSAPGGGLWQVAVADTDGPVRSVDAELAGTPSPIGNTGAAMDGVWLPDGNGLLVLEPGAGDRWLRRGDDAQPLLLGSPRSMPTRMASAGGYDVVLTDDTGGDAWRVVVRGSVLGTDGLVAEQYDLHTAAWVGTPTPDDLGPLTEATMERRLVRGSGLTYGADGVRIVSTGGNKPDPGAAPFGAGPVTYGRMAASNHLDLDYASTLAVEVERSGQRTLQLLRYANGSSGVAGGEVEADVALLGGPVALDGSLDGLRLAPDAPYGVWLSDGLLTAAVADAQGLRVLGEISLQQGSGVPPEWQVVDWIDLTATRVDATPGERIVSLGLAAAGAGTTRVTLALTDDSVTLLDREVVDDENVRVRLAGRFGPALVEFTLTEDGHVRWATSNGDAAGTFDVAQGWRDLTGLTITAAGDQLVVARGDVDAWQVRFRSSLRPGGVAPVQAPARAAV